MKKLTALSLTCALAISGYAKDSNVRECPEPQPVPKEIMEPIKPDFLSVMRTFLFDSPNAPTPPQDD
jgi:hypothetical protein